MHYQVNIKCTRHTRTYCFRMSAVSVFRVVFLLSDGVAVLSSSSSTPSASTSTSTSTSSSASEREQRFCFPNVSVPCTLLCVRAAAAAAFSQRISNTAHMMIPLRALGSSKHTRALLSTCV